MEVLKATISCGDLSSHKLFVDVLAIQMAHDWLGDNLLEIGRGGIIPLLDGAAKFLVRNASHVQSLEDHRGLSGTFDSAALEVNACKKVLEKCRVEASLPQAV